MDSFNDFLTKMEDPNQREKMMGILNWVAENYPDLEQQVKWNQPMFVDHGTYIIGFSVSKKHIAISPEVAGINKFKDEIAAAGYSQTENIFRIEWNDVVDFALLKDIIDFNRFDKADATKFWR